MKQHTYERIEKAFFSRKLKFALLSRITKSGLDLSLASLFTRLYTASYILTFVVLVYQGIRIYTAGTFGTLNFIITLLSSALLIFVAAFIGILIGFVFYLNLRIYNRTKEIEKVLPDFLQLTAANISAGMSIDKALWFSIRPRFGILAKEIETVAKKSMSGEDLEQALKEFASKYDSPTLDRPPWGGTSPQRPTTFVRTLPCSETGERF